jgi:hypothetical protein
LEEGYSGSLPLGTSGVRMQSIHSKRDAANWTSEYMIMSSHEG